RDGEYGPRTQSAELKRDKAAAASGGLTEAQGDARYVPKGQPVVIRGTS
ncbi:hypothetical protein LCGC14_2028860, partial [marine sediment metagenome]